MVAAVLEVLGRSEISCCVASAFHCWSSAHCKLLWQDALWNFSLSALAADGTHKLYLCANNTASNTSFAGIYRYAGASTSASTLWRAPKPAESGRLQVLEVGGRLFGGQARHALLEQVVRGPHPVRAAGPAVLAPLAGACTAAAAGRLTTSAAMSTSAAEARGGWHSNQACHGLPLMRCKGLTSEHCPVRPER
jgi:hypothetical protein